MCYFPPLMCSYRSNLHHLQLDVLRLGQIASSLSHRYILDPLEVSLHCAVVWGQSLRQFCHCLCQKVCCLEDERGAWMTCIWIQKLTIPCVITHDVECVDIHTHKLAWDFMNIYWGVLTTTASVVVPSDVMTAGVLLMTVVAKGAWMLLVSCANSGCFLRMCCTIFV